MADPLDCADDRLPGRARAELLEHPVADPVPEPIADAPVDPHIPHDGKRAVVDREVDEDAVPRLRAVHAELREEPPRLRERVHTRAEEAARQAALEVHADLGRGVRLGGLDGVAHRVEVRHAEEPPRPLRMRRHPLPASARAAAARRAPTAREAAAATATATGEAAPAAPEDGTRPGPAATAARRVAAALTRGLERHAADRHRREAEEEKRVEVRRLLALPLPASKALGLAPQLGGRRRPARPDPRVDRGHRGLEAGGEALLSEARRDHLADDLARGGVGHDPLEPVADLEAKR